MYFGCRRRDVDYIYREEIEGWEANGKVLTKVNLALSREPGVKKTYV